MKPDIHPNYSKLNVRCACGHKLAVNSTLASDDLSVDVCSKCHPFYTGKATSLVERGRAALFKQKYSKLYKKQDSE